MQDRCKSENPEKEKPSIPKWFKGSNDRIRRNGSYKTSRNSVKKHQQQSDYIEKINEEEINVGK